MTTTVVYSGGADGYIASVGTYAAARAGTGTLSAYYDVTSFPTVEVGQVYGDATTKYVYEAFLGFDTSAVGTDAISAAVLNVTSSRDESTTDFIFEVRLRDWGGTLTTADFVPGANLAALTLLAHYGTASGWVVNTAYDFVDDAMAANVNKTGTTYLILASRNTRIGTDPTGAENASLYSADYTGTTSDPKLTVTHVAAAGFAYSQAVVIA